MKRYTYFRGGQSRRLWVKAGRLGSADQIMGWIGFSRYPLLTDKEWHVYPACPRPFGRSPA